MFKRVLKVRHNRRQAFTIVEIIVVLVILAIIAGVTIPALTGYIKRAKKEKYYDNAHYALVAAQSVMTELYSQGGITAQDLSKDGLTTDKNNINWASGSTNQAWGDKVLALMDRDRSNEPSILVVGVGYTSFVKPDLSSTKPYTVYYVAYLENDNAPAVFYVNGVWRYKYPTSDPALIKKTPFKDEAGTNKNLNTIIDGDIKLQFYVISNKHKLDDGKLWINESEINSLISHSEGHNGY